MASKKSVLIIGGNRGIGLNLLKSFVEASWDVTGTIRPQSRNDPSLTDLRLTGARVLELDYLRESTIKKAVVGYGKERTLDVLINIGGLTPNPKPWTEQTDKMLVEKIRVMAVGPFLVIKHFLPLLERSPQPKVINISSAFGSVTDNTIGTCMAYRVATAALNQESVTLAREWEKEGRKPTIIVMEPGFIPTRLTDNYGVDNMNTCITGIRKVIDGITHEDNGAFIKWDGSRLRF